MYYIFLIIPNGHDEIFYIGLPAPPTSCIDMSGVGDACSISLLFSGCTPCRASGSCP